MLWDRVAGAAASLPASSVLLGRYQVPAGEQGWSLGGRAAPPGSYLAGVKRWTLRSRGTQRWSGSFGDSPVPAPIVLESITSVARELTGLRHSDAPLSVWTDVAPVVNRMEERLRTHPLDSHLRTEFRYLRTVCRAPHARLRTEDVLMPTGQVRRISWRTVVHLAGHSETWAARKLHGVEPAQLLVPVRVADHDLYENRVVATLLGRLWQHLCDRIEGVKSIDEMRVRGRDLFEEIRRRPDWRQRDRLYNFISPILMQDDLAERIRRLLDELYALRGALAPLLRSELMAGVRGPYTGPSRLRPTNLLDNDVNYRHCRRLWNAEVASRQAADGLDEPDQVMVRWCQDFAQYALLLVLRAMDQLGMVPLPDSRPPARGGNGPGPGYRYREQTVRLGWNPDDTFSLTLDGEAVLRIVPLPHALTRVADQPAIDGALQTLELPGGAPCVAVLYPGEVAERSQLPLSLRLAVHSVRGQGRLPALVPVSPADLGTMGRVAQLLRIAIEERIMLAYPKRVTCRVAEAKMLAGRFKWIRWQPGELLVVQPPPHHELALLEPALAALRSRTDAARQRGDNGEHLKRLHADLVSAVPGITALTWCAYCLQPSPDAAASFSPRDNGTYRCDCPRCQTSWEVRRCPSCQERYATMAIPALAGHVGGDGDRLDVVFSQGLLATPCWERARSRICPACGICPESSQPAVRAACDRCRPSA